MSANDSSFKPGNPGKPKGASNRLTASIKERIESVLEKLDETLIGDIEEMKPAARVELWRDLQEYVRPKLSRKEHTGEGGGPVQLQTIRLIEVRKEKPTAERGEGTYSMSA